MSRLVLVLMVFVASLLSGCYSFTASTLPSHIKTVKIHEVEDKTLDPVLANNIRAGVLEMFRKNAGGVRVVNDNANADFEMTLLSYTNKPENYNSSSDVETYRVTIRVSVKFYDNVKERVIYESKSLKLQDLIITNALAKW